MKGKALRRALATTDIVRLSGNVPLLTDTTELISPTRAYELLERNKANRPIKWHRVEAYAAIMRAGNWKLHGQGLLLDTHGNVLTGQHRLWAVIYADTPVPMRISRGNPPEVAPLIDRGVAQSARDLAHRKTGKTHSAQESNLVRAALVLRGVLRPSVDDIAAELVAKHIILAALLNATTGTKKTRAVLMVLGALCAAHDSPALAAGQAVEVERLADRLTMTLHPQTPESCWGRGAAFSLAMQQAKRLCDA